MRARLDVVQPNERGFYECAHCPSEYTSSLAAASCCDKEYDAYIDREDARQ